MSYEDYGEQDLYVPGYLRVCFRCGSLVANEYLTEHDRWHGDTPPEEEAPLFELPPSRPRWRFEPRASETD